MPCARASSASRRTKLTYDLHIVLRSEIEAALMAGEADVPDLPKLWREKMRDYLDLEAPSDTLGVLQDVHWSSGMMGSFPTYTLGNLMASQFFAAARTDPAVKRGLDAGDYAPLRFWLNQHVHRHGRSKSPTERLVAATGRDLDLAPYLGDLRENVGRLQHAPVG